MSGIEEQINIFECPSGCFPRWWTIRDLSMATPIGYLNSPDYLLRKGITSITLLSAFIGMGYDRLFEAVGAFVCQNCAHVFARTDAFFKQLIQMVRVAFLNGEVSIERDD